MNPTALRQLYKIIICKNQYTFENAKFYIDKNQIKPYNIFSNNTHYVFEIKPYSFFKHNSFVVHEIEHGIWHKIGSIKYWP